MGVGWFVSFPAYNYKILARHAEIDCTEDNRGHVEQSPH